MARVSVVYQVYQRYNEALEWLEIRLSVPVKVWRSAGAPHPLWSLALGREIRCRDSMVEPCLTSTEQDLQFGTSNIFTCLRFFSVPVTVPVPVTSF